MASNADPACFYCPGWLFCKVTTQHNRTDRYANKLQADQELEHENGRDVWILLWVLLEVGLLGASGDARVPCSSVSSCCESCWKAGRPPFLRLLRSVT